MNPIIFVLVLSSFISYYTSVSGAKILGLYPLPGDSHYHLHRALYRALAERGHDVTVVNCFGEKTPPKNGTYRDILLTGLCERKPQGDKNWNMFKREGLNPFVSTYVTVTLAGGFIEKTLAHENVQKLLRTSDTFDVVIVDQFLSDAYKAFALRFNAPLIILNPVGANYWVNHFVGNPEPASYVPNILMEFPPKMTFCERLTNSLVYVFNELLYNFYYIPKHAAIAREYISKDVDLYDVLYNTSLVLLNSHPSTNQPVPHVPNMIEVAGFHVSPPQRLPQDLQEFMDGAKEGVIYFSMGSNLKSVQFPAEKREAFIKAFSQLRQKVLWKWEGDELPGKPSNVKLIKWAPQQDVLAHPNLKLFITHGGFVSSVETAYHGVPVLVIPIFGDQYTNAHFANDNGFGTYISFKNISEDTLTRTINQILTNPKYKQNAVKRSNAFHDRPVSAKETALYWVEYVIRHRGAPHLRVAGLDLPWYKYYLVDVVGVIVVATFVFLLCLYWVAKKVFKILCVKNKCNKKKLKQK